MFTRAITIALLVTLSLWPSRGEVLTPIEDVLQTGVLRNSTKTKRSDYCLTEDGERGECLPYYLCDGGVASTDGANVIDIRIAGSETSCTYLNVCCLPPDVRDTNNPIKPTIRKGQGCGWRNPNGLGFSITGNSANEAEFGEFPWMVAVLRPMAINNRQSASMYIGGGSLIHPSVVLTAAHILNTSAAVRVRAGEWDAMSDDEQYPNQERNVAEVDIHESYNRANLQYDAALLFLESPIEMAPNVGLACIPIKEEYSNPNAECFATGWGMDKFGKEGRFQNIMKKIRMQVVDRDRCEMQLRRTRLQRYFRLHHSFVCAGGEAGMDMCTGDGGSPLVCPIQFERDRYKQVGMVAWGIECGRQGVPGVYADVAGLGGWIDRRLAQRGYDTSVYRY